MQPKIRQFDLLSFIPAVAAAVVLATHPSPVRAATGTGTVYVMTNQSTRNAILVFHRSAAGQLSFLAGYATGGQGTGTGADPLGSQNSLVLSDDQHLLLNVNAGSNSVSVFLAFGDQLKLLDTVSSGGVMPVSVAIRQGLVYVVNAGGTPNITGFRFDPTTSHLVPLAGSIQSLPGGAAAAPAQISFRPDGGVLFVTEKGTNLVDTFTLQNGIAQPGTSFAASGTTPFGFAFSSGVAVVSNAEGGGTGASTVTSYGVAQNGNVGVITPALGDTQSAACWLVTTPDGTIAYVANSASATISSYTVAADGSLALLSPVTVTTAGGSTPTDMALSTGGHFLYVRNGGNGTLSAFRVEADRSLSAIGGAQNIPAGAQGIAAK